MKLASYEYSLMSRWLRLSDYTIDDLASWVVNGQPLYMEDDDYEEIMRRLNNLYETFEQKTGVKLILDHIDNELYEEIDGSVFCLSRSETVNFSEKVVKLIEDGVDIMFK